MQIATSTTKFELNTRYTNPRGTAWVEIRLAQHPSNYYHVYYLRYWASDFYPEITKAEGPSDMRRSRIERQARNWLESR